MSNGTIYRAQRVLFHELAYLESSDAVVEIEVGGTQLFLDEARYAESRGLGLTSCMNGFYIDKICTAGATK